MKSDTSNIFIPDFKEIHIGSYIERRVKELNVSEERISSFINTDIEHIQNMYKSSSLDTDLLLRWSKLLKYDFFRLYSQHLILYTPVSAATCDDSKKTILPQFKKSVYTKEIISFVLKKISSKEMTLKQVLDKYKIPKTTLHRWIKKNKIIL